MSTADLRRTWRRRSAVATSFLVLALASSTGGCRSRSKNSAMTPAPEGSSVTSRDVSTGADTDATAPSGTPTKEPASDTVAYTGVFGAATGYATLKIGGRNRRVYVYVPPRHSPKPPLVVAFHGTGGNMGDGAHDGAMSELSIREVADANGFVVVAPFSTSEGGVNADHETGGNGWRFDDDVEANIDLAFTRASIQEARRAYRIDATHVYAVGMSNGAFFAYFAAMKLANRFAAFAESSGGLVPCGKRADCEFSKAGLKSCAALMAAAPPTCKCAIGANAFPTTKPARPGARVPQGLLKHNADDTTVSAVYTCRLGEHLGGRSQVMLDGTGEHGPTNDFMPKAWAFFATKSLAD